MKKIFIYIVFILCSTSSLWGQVADINKNAEKDKANSGKKKSAESSTSSTSGDGSLFFFFTEVLVHTVGAAQIAALENKDIYPERVSLESFATFGAELPSNTIYFQSNLRLNWGIFASDFTYSSLNDVTGSLKSIDWLVIVFRIPIKNFKLDYGLGFISLVDLDQSYFKNSLGFDWRLANPGINISSAYQWSEKTSLGSKYKENFTFRVDYNAYSYKKIHFNPLFEYAFQNYFEQTKYSMYSVGLMIRIF